jgi:hypothetical protein
MALAWTHSNPEADASALHLGSLLNPLVSGIRVDHGFFTMQQLSSRGEVRADSKFEYVLWS